jgi:hypothetical protein
MSIELILNADFQFFKPKALSKLILYERLTKNSAKLIFNYSNNKQRASDEGF